MFRMITTLCLFTLLATGQAFAEPSAAEKALASQLFEEGKKLANALQFTEACPKFAESQRLDSQLGTLMHLADCYGKTGKTASAWTSFREAAAIAAQRRDKREQYAKARVKELEANLSKLEIDVDPGAPDDLEVRQNETTVGRAAWGIPLPVDPGPHTVSARAAGFRDWSVHIEVQTGASVAKVSIPKLEAAPVAISPTPVVAVEPVSPSAGAVQPAQATDQPKAPRPQPVLQLAPADNPDTAVDKTGPGLGQRTAGLIVGGAGVAALSAGAVFAVIARSKISDRDAANACTSTDEGCTSAQAAEVRHMTSIARTHATIANTALVAGGVLVATGVVLVLTSSPSTQRASRSLEVRSWAGPTGAGLAMGGVW